jgi:hypothetical protein
MKVEFSIEPVRPDEYQVGFLISIDRGGKEVSRYFKLAACETMEVAEAILSGFQNFTGVDDPDTEGWDHNVVITVLLCHILDQSWRNKETNQKEAA